jgi:hypothetical protein
MFFLQRQSSSNASRRGCFCGGGNKTIIIVIIVEIIVMIQPRILALQVILQVNILDNKEISSPLFQDSTLGSKATGLKL